MSKAKPQNKHQKLLDMPNYQAWKIKETDFPANAGIEEKIRFISRYGILAPSTHNTQPWQFDISANEMVIKLDPALALPKADPHGRGSQISLGAFTSNIVLASEYFGLTTKVKWSSDKVLISFSEGQRSRSNKYIKAITSRYSDKLPYKEQELSKFIINKLTQLPAINSCYLNLITEKDQIKKLSDYHFLATLSYSSDREFFAELSNWLRPAKTSFTDGMPGFVVGLSNGQSKIMKSGIKKLKIFAKIIAKKDREVILSSPAVGVITSKDNAPKTWFEAGRLYELLALEASALGLVTSPISALVEKSSYFKKLAKELGLDGHAQVIFRLGHSQHPVYHTPRNSIPNTTMDSQQALLREISGRFETKQVQIDKYRINYLVGGQGKPVLMLHGANIGWAQWYKNVADLSKNFRVYALDLPGAGNSTKLNFHEADFEKDFLETVDKFVKKIGLKKIDIIGSSFGGWIALKLAIMNRPYIDKIVLTNPIAFTRHMPIQFRPASIWPFAKFLSMTALRPQRSNKNLEKFMRDVFYKKNQPLAPEFVDYFYDLSKTSHNLLFISRLSGLSGMQKDLFLADELHKINRPVLLIWGVEDPLMPLRNVESNIKLIPGVKFIKLEKVGHMPPVEASNRFNKETIKFLKGK